MVEPKEKRRASKSETLTIRLDPKTRFMLEFMSRLRGQTITTVVERAIVEDANRSTIPTGFGDPEDWRDFWSAVEGERALNIAKERALYPTYEEEKRLSFTREHWQFFYTTKDCTNYLRHYVEVLWPRIDEFIDIFDSRKTDDYFAAGKAMKDALTSAGLATPQWPPVAARKIDKGAQKDIDDEIPF